MNSNDNFKTWWTHYSHKIFKSKIHTLFSSSTTTRRTYWLRK